MLKINFKKLNGLVPAIIQDVTNGLVLMLGFMNEESLQKTIRTKKVWFYSRSKGRLWMKGESSKNILRVVSIVRDCDNDSLLIRVKPTGPTCHTGAISCFTTVQPANFLIELWNTIKVRQKELPQNSYTASLFKDGIDAIVQKVGEEATEVVIAGKNKSKQRLVEESCDLLYHLLVLLVSKGVDLHQIGDELYKRRRNSQA